MVYKFTRPVATAQPSFPAAIDVTDDCSVELLKYGKAKSLKEEASQSFFF
jgi:hypothetical protein